MKPNRLSQWLRASVLLAICSFTAYACDGSTFTATGGGHGGGASGRSGSTARGGGPSADAGDFSAGGETVKGNCRGPEDCDDGDPCTLDDCGKDGICTISPKCGPTEKCCDGACGQCCGQADCNDEVKCTDDVCFAGACTHAANNATCKADEYCSVTNGCRKKEACSVAMDCDDADKCTDDACSASLCNHVATACPNNGVCCPGVGCAECCDDAGCNDKDPCTKDSCSAGKCKHADFCGDGKCCPAADKTSATCGSCCSAADCNDSVSCTKDSCAQGACGHTADPAQCRLGYACDPVKGCQVTDKCIKASDCAPGSGCQTASCVSGKCSYTDCGTGTNCCSDKTCKACCADADCNDNVSCTVDTCNDGVCSHKADQSLCGRATPTCDPANGGCIQCTTDAQCDDKSECTVDSCDLSSHTCRNVAKVCAAKGLLCCGTSCAACCNNLDCQGGVTAFIAPIGGNSCPVSTCSNGTCVTTKRTCPFGSSCCASGCCSIEVQ